MILLDTNVISEVMRLSPSSAVLAWLHAIPVSDLATTTVNVAEIRYGVARLPFGRRRYDLESRFNNYLVRVFANRVFGFDAAAADAYGELVAERTRIGRPLQRFDGLIAAIASSRRVGIATRDVRGFEWCGIELVNPWEVGAA